jgi:hypothetical protein
MLSAILPQQIDNAYRGHKIALWLFGLLLILRTVIGVNSIVNGYLIASTADGIPLDSYGPAAAQTVVTLFALLGLSTLIICALGVLTLVRYRAMVPLMFALLLLEYAARKLILYLMPIAKTGASPGWVVNLVLLTLMLAGLALSLWSRERPQVA